MKEIDTSGWGEFRVGELFDVVKGSRLRSLDRVDGEIPYIGATLFDNGYVQTIGNDESLHPGGVLTACYNGRATGVTFYQPEQFWATDDVNVLYPKFQMSEEIGLFIAPVIQSVGMNFGWESKWNLPDMIGAVIRLPVTTVGDPDWEFMEQTMRDVLAQQEHELDELIVVTVSSGRSIDTSSWGEFQVGDLFEVTRPAPRAKLGYLDGKVPFVSTSSFNNGVSEWVDANGEEFETGECITVNALDGTAFWQPVAFLGRGGAGSSISILRRDGLNQHTGLFLAATITAACHASYDTMLSGTALREVIIRLPVTAEGDPDWEFMEQTMRDAMAERETALGSLQALAGV